MKEFYQKTSQTQFFRNNKEFYNKAISKIKTQIWDEKLFGKVLEFYQSNQKGLELIVFIELTNNANNKAVSFYDNYNTEKRAMILANICDVPKEANKFSHILELDNDIHWTIYHETSHLFTHKLLEENIGELNHYNLICEGYCDIQIRDKIDHLIIFPLQGIMSDKFHSIKE